MLLICISCSKAGGNANNHLGDYRGQGIEYRMSVPSDTLSQLEILVSAGSNSSEINMNIMGDQVIARLTKDSFTIEPGFDPGSISGSGIFVRDTMHISYTLGADANNISLILASLIKQ